MSWNSSYETGVDEIDRQNFELLDYIEVMKNTEDNKTRLMQLEIFEELVKKNFMQEQRLHDECRYFDAFWHKISHQAYIKKLQHTKHNLSESGATLENENIFRTQVVEFLKYHITCHDKSFAHFYNDNKFCENFVEQENTFATAML